MMIWKIKKHLKVKMMNNKIVSKKRIKEIADNMGKIPKQVEKEIEEAIKEIDKKIRETDAELRSVLGV
jgi:hypothetical protein